MITVSSLCGRREEMEPRLSGLFPDTSSSRAHQFTGKKVSFLKYQYASLQYIDSEI